MSKATVYSTAQFGLVAETSSTGIVAGTISWSGTSETAELPNHYGCAIGFAVWNPKKDISIDGIISAKGAGLVGNIGAVVAIANATANSRTRNQEGLGVTPNANAAFVVTGNTITPTQNGFEAGGCSGVYLPGVATNSPTEITS